MKPEFVHLHVHTDFSQLDGMSKPAAYIERAKQLGQTALAVTDHGNLAALPEFYMEARKVGIDPILGSEMYFVPDVESTRQAKGKKDDTDAARYHITVLARGEAGYRALSELSTESFRNFYYKPLVSRAILERADLEHLVILSGCANSILSKLCLQDPAAAEEELQWWLRTCPHFAIELQHHGTAFDDDLNRQLLRLARHRPPKKPVRSGRVVELDSYRTKPIPWVITQDSHYVMADEACHHDVLLALQTGSDIDSPTRLRFDGSGYHLRSTEELQAAFGGYPGPVVQTGLAASAAIARSCAGRISAWEKRSWHIPRAPGVENAQEHLERLAIRGLKERKLHKKPEYVERMRHELDVIGQAKIADFLLITLDIIQWARRKKIPVGPGRGSVCGSLVAWLIGLHQVDPIRYNLLFERFLNPARPSMPDIDTDFGQARRDELFDYVKKRYGEENVLHVAAWGRMRVRRMFNALAKSHGLSFGEAQQISKTLNDDDEEISLPDHVTQSYPDLVEQLQALVGIRASVGAHPAGVLIASPEHEISKTVPQMFIPSSKRWVAQYDLEAVDRMGYLKEDLLGLRTLDTIDIATKLIEQSTGEQIDPYSWVPDEEPRDDEVYAMLAAGDTAGVFQMEGPVNTRGIQEVGCTCFEDIVSCFPAGTLVSGPTPVAGLNRRYVGPLLTLKFASGRILSVTPNHPLLGLSGWVPAGQVRVGDGLCYATTVQGPSPGTPDIQNIPTPIEQVVDAFDQSARVASRYVNFYGERPTADVDVVWSNCLLQDGFESGRPQSLSYSAFSLAYLGSCFLLGDGSSLTSPQKRAGSNIGPSPFERSESYPPVIGVGQAKNFGFRPRSHSNGMCFKDAQHVAIGGHNIVGDLPRCQPSNVALDNSLVFAIPPRESLFDDSCYSLSCHSSSLRRSLVGQPKRVGFTIAANDYASLSKPFCDHLVGDTVPSADSLRRFAGDVAVDYVIDVQVVSFAGQVMTLQSSEGWYLANGIVARNCTALYRTGPILAKFPEQFIANRQAITPPYPHPSLEPVLSSTAGVMIYQEQTMTVARVLAGFSWAQADDIKEAIKHKKSPLMKSLKPAFVKGCVANGVSKLVANQVWRQIEGMATYGYNRGHAVVYSMTSYVTARLKLLYPGEFFVALLRTVEGKEKRNRYLRAILRRGFKILPPDINHSEARATLVSRDPVTIRFGLQDYAGIGHNRVVRLITARPFRGYTHPAQVAQLVDKGTYKILVHGGALRSLDVPGNHAMMADLLGWQFKDRMARWRSEWDGLLDEPDDEERQVQVLGELIQVTAGKTKNDKPYRTWVVRWAPATEWSCRLWSEAEDYWKLPVGSLVRVQGIWQPSWDNIVVNAKHHSVWYWTGTKWRLADRYTVPKEA